MEVKFFSENIDGNTDKIIFPSVILLEIAIFLFVCYDT